MNDTDFDLVPADPVVTPDDELNAAMSGLVPDTTEDPQIPFGRGWGFDFETNTVLTEARGLANLQVWIQKTLRTSQLSHPIYSDEYGTVGLTDAIGQRFTSSMAADMARTITDALLFHDRIAAVQDFQFDSSATDTVLNVSFTVVTDEGDDVSVTLPTTSITPQRSY